MNIVARLDACITNMQAIANSARREGEEIAVHTADELVECRKVASDMLQACKDSLAFAAGHPDRTPAWHAHRERLFSQLDAVLVEAEEGRT